MEGVLRVRWLKGNGKAAGWGQAHQNKCLHLDHYHQGGSEPGLEQLDNLYIPRTSLTFCFFVHDDSSPLFWREAMHLPSAFCLHDPFGLHTRKMPSAYAYTSFVSDLVLAKPGTISKRLGKLLLLITN